MRSKWDSQDALLQLKKWIEDGKWRGTIHFRQYNTSLYEYLYRTFGLEDAFKKIGFNYIDFKKKQGKRLKKRSEQEINQDLQNLIQSNQWEGVRDLQLNHSLLYRELSRIGFAEAFRRIGLDYRNYRKVIWTRDDVLQELKAVINEGKWQGAAHLKHHHSFLYNAITREMSFSEAFREIGLDYDKYRKDR